MTVVTDLSAATSVFGRVLVGVDGTPEGLEAAAQAGLLVAPEGVLELMTAVYLSDGRLQGWPEERMNEVLEREGGPVLAAAAKLVPRAATRLLEGPPLQTLMAEAAAFRATLIAVGSHDYSRLSEIVIGGVSGRLLHESRCSVLVARSAVAAGRFPAGLVVGVDGSQSSLAALAVAEYLSGRFAAPLRVLLARHGDVDVIRAELQAPQLEILDGRPVEVLADAAEAADLLIVGSRGLHGLGAVGSVSERVAHKGRSSVLVVRTQAGTQPTSSGTDVSSHR